MALAVSRPTTPTAIPPRARAATHFTAKEAKALSLSILGWGATAKPHTFQSEHVLQIAVASYLDRALPPDAFWTSIDSAGRGARDGARMKRRGVKRGVPDILVMWRSGTTWIELKSATGKPTAEQNRFAQAALRAGHGCWLCRSLYDVEVALGFMPLRCKVSA